jgi:hypothetical protein
MGLGTTAALTGLSKSVDYVGANQREMAAMDGLQKDIQAEKQQNLLAQELEAKQYEEIAAKAADMLGPDRKKIQAKSLVLQQSIRAKIEEYGSRKAFFENGGVALLSKYKSDVLNSEETLSYMDNKKNSESLLKLQESGKGSLIAARDLQSLIDYNNGVGNGKITYSGLKSEVKIPVDSFNYQEEVPAGNILAGNKMAIYNNWLLDNPDKKHLTGQPLEEQLMVYTMNNYHGLGTNQTKYQYDLARSKQKEEDEALKKAGTEEDDTPISTITEMNNGLTSNKDIPPTLDNIMGDENYTVRVARSNKGLTAIAGRLTPFTEFSSNTSSADSNWISGTQWVDKTMKGASRALGLDDKYMLAGAALVPVRKTKEMVEYLFPGSTSPSAITAVLNETQFYSANGQLLKKEYVEDNKDTPLKYSGLIYAYVDGNNKMITKKLDSNGKSFPKTKGADGKWQISQEEKDHRKAYSGDITHDMFAVLVDEDGRKIYHRVDAQGMAREAELTEIIGVSDNIKDKVKAKQKFVDRTNKVIAETILDSKVYKNEVAIASSEGGIFSTPEFKADVKASEVAGNGNRANLTKAYYLAASYMRERGTQKKSGMTGSNLMLEDGIYKRNNPSNFSTAVNYSKELKDALINKKSVNDVDFIKMFEKTHSSGTPEHKESNAQAAAIWMKFYELLNKK